MLVNKQQIKKLTDDLEKNLDSGVSEEIIVKKFKSLIELFSKKLVDDLKEIRANVVDPKERRHLEDRRVQEYKILIGEIAHYIDNNLGSKLK